MGRKSHRRALNLWMNGALVGEWAIAPGGGSELTYAPEWLASHAYRPLSLSLPANFDGAPLRGEVVSNYFDNLLPDSDKIRRRLQQRFGTASQEAFDLLTAIGRDCVGAVQLLPIGVVPAGPHQVPLQLEPLDEAGIAHCLRQAVAGNVIQGLQDDADDFRISIAGAQEKTALTFYEGRWHRPSGVTPTTHIFKLPLGLVGGMQADMGDSVENEWLCGQILAEFGLQVANSEIAQFEDQRALVVERFDRTWSEAQRIWLRLPQEDMCQARGLPPHLKYEKDGGPGIVNIASLLQASMEQEQDVENFLKAQLIMWFLAATDGHAKNFSIRLLPGGRFRLTPLYDVLSAWPIVGHGSNQLPIEKVKMAMAQEGKNRHYRLREIQRRHFNATAQQCGLSKGRFDAVIDDVIANVPRVIDTVASRLPKGFPDRVFGPIAQGMMDGAKRLGA